MLMDRPIVHRPVIGSPKDKLTLCDDYTRGVRSDHAKVTGHGNFNVTQNNAALDQTHDPRWVLDVSGIMRVAGTGASRSVPIT
ncbi:MAG: hypothetical protein WCC39_18385 [Telluria sp.]